MGEKEQRELSLEPGEVLAGKYRIEAQIGSGGMGVVLAAHHVAIGNRVAIKVLRLDEERDPQGAVARFVREARAAARVQNEHVVRVTDVASLSDGTPYMVMEYLDGIDLRHLIDQQGQVEIADAIAYVLQACEGLAEAHAAGVIHRDLKPSNLFLVKRKGSAPVLKILDFGISKVTPRAGETALTTTTSLMGSPLYMAPEQMRSSKNVDARADIWSLGLILYELLAGNPPFEGETIPLVCTAVMGLPPTPMGRFRDDIPEALNAILLRCLEKDPERRFANVGELARQLAPFAPSLQRIHAERAAALAYPSRPPMVTEPDEEYAPVRSARGGTLKGGLQVEPLGVPEASGSRTPRRANDPDTIPSWTGSKEGGKRRATWIGAGIAVALLAVLSLVVVVVRPGTSVPAAPGTIDRAPTAAPLPQAPPQPVPPSTGELASVPFDSLPVSARDAGAPRAAKHPPRAATPPTAAPPPAASTNKDAWKWGDRN